MSDPNTIRGWLSQVEGHLAAIAINSATIADALRAPLNGQALPPGEQTIAQMLAGALFVPPRPGAGPNLPGLLQVLQQHIGGPDDDPLRTFLEAIFLSTANIPGIARALGGFVGDERSPQLHENISSLRFLTTEIVGNLQTGEYPAPLRGAIQEIVALLSNLIDAASQTQVSTADANVLLQRLLNCTPCGDALPEEPTLCDGSAGFLSSTSWTEHYDVPSDTIYYFANMDGNFNIGQFTFVATPVTPFADAPEIQGFVAVKAGQAPRDVLYCMEWAGNSQLNDILSMAPLGNAILVNAGVTMNSPAPNSESDTDQVFGPGASANSTYYVFTTRNPNGGALPDTSRVFITPQVIS